MDQEFLKIANELLNQEMENLRKKFRPYKRRPFLQKKVIIEIAKGKEYEKCLGFYDNTKQNDRDFNYFHKIYLTDVTIENYLSWASFGKACQKRYGIDGVRTTIRHELIHAFVFEEFEEWETIKWSHSDYSPIFLSCLYWCGGSTGHKYTHKFIESDLYKITEECKSYDEVQTILIHLLIEYERAVEKINKDCNKDTKNLKKIEAEFNISEAGIKKISYYKTNVKYLKNGKFTRGTVQIMKLGIGFLVTPKTLLNNYKRKFDNEEIAKTHFEDVVYMYGNNTNMLKRINIA